MEKPKNILIFLKHNRARPLDNSASKTTSCRKSIHTYTKYYLYFSTKDIMKWVIHNYCLICDFMFSLVSFLALLIIQLMLHYSSFTFGRQFLPFFVCFNTLTKCFYYLAFQNFALSVAVSFNFVTTFSPTSWNKFSASEYCKKLLNYSSVCFQEFFTLLKVFRNIKSHLNIDFQN